MKERILGIDTGTNSIGWAIVDYDKEASENRYTLIDKGVNIFQEGVKIEKGIESSRAAERTMHKHQRVGYWRRKIRKIALLKVLSGKGMCPPLSKEELKAWRSHKQYPVNEEFMAWQLTDEAENKNPYYYRHLCLTEKLDLSTKADRYILGRAIYHLNQRRGFLSNRKEDTKENDGTVKQGIDGLTASMLECGTEYLGEYYYRLYQKGEKIRTHYTSRVEHIEHELLAICRKQELSEELTCKLRRIIVTQRPLKSQKHTVGKCVFEPAKSRCPASHPLYEQYRMYAFINNIKMQGPYEDVLRPLTADEKRDIIPLFLRKSKKDFLFEDIAKKLAGGKKNYCYYKEDNDKPYRFNYYMDTSVSGCPVISQLSEAFETKNSEDAWLDAACEVYTCGSGKSKFQIMNDIWHALFFFDDADKLKEFAKQKLQMDDKHAGIFSNIKIPADYASLSLKAIRKILPYMKEYGMIYSHAVFLANIPSVINCKTITDEVFPILPPDDAKDIVAAFNNYNPEKSGVRTREEFVKQYITLKYNLDEQNAEKLKSLYHPSMIETFPKVWKRSEEGYYQLGSPRTGSIRNPMAMHSLFRLRHVINTLLAEGKIDEKTTVRIEFARELNDANKRAAIRRWQNENEKKRKEYSERIKEHFGDNHVPSETELLKYQLWVEQKGICLYTGKTIGMDALFDPNRFDIEHTIPRSVGGDSTAMNLTLCDSRFNRETKRTKIPSQLDKHDEILERIAHWKEEIEKLDKEIRKINTRGTADKEMKDRLIQKRHLLVLERDYLKGKYERFTMKEVPEGFSRRQGVDISVISRYARLYLKSLFGNVHIVKGLVTSDFRKIWGLQEEYDKKLRINHCHHAMDAITVACIGRYEYDSLARYYHDEERRRWGLECRRAEFPKPWNTFTEDVKDIEDSLPVSHYTADNMNKRTRKKVRRNGRFTGEYMEGDTARMQLHQDSYYGAIERDGEVRYVIRKPVGDVDPEKIVDEAVREKVKAAVKEHGSLKKAVEAGIWMNEEKGIRINKVRVYTPNITRPVNIRRHRDVSEKEYKREFHVANDSNYIMGIFVGEGKNGKEKRDFKLVNALDAADYYNSDSAAQNIDILPATSQEHGYPLKWSLKIGTMVLLYENTPEEIYELDNKGLVKRLYKITGMSSSVVSGYEYGNLVMRFHQESRQSTDSACKIKKGIYKQNEAYRSIIGMSHLQFNGLVQGRDFKINDLGEIEFMHR